MKVKRLWLWLLVLLLLWPVSAVFAEEPAFDYDGGQIFVGEDVSLEPGETFDGDLGVLDGDLTVPESSVVDGDLFVINGDAYVAGRVNGDLAVIRGELILTEPGRVTGDVVGMSAGQDVAGYVGGSLSAVFGDLALRSTSVVKGDLLVSPGDLEREEGAQVDGEQVHEFVIPSLPFIPEDLKELTMQTPVPPSQVHGPQLESFGQRVGRFVGRAMAATLLGLVFIGIGCLLVFVWPRATKRVSDCIAVLPIQSFGLGLLTYLIAAILEVLAMVILVVIVLVGTALIGTVILLPVGLLLIVLSLLVLLPVPLALAGAMILGWVGLAVLIGEKILKALRVQNVAPLGAALVGLLITVGLTAILWIIQPACCAWPFVILLTSVGLGAVIHTRFGKQSCRGAKTEAEPDALPPEAMDEETGQPDGPASTTS